MRRPAIIIALLCSVHTLFGQIETTQYFMTTLPQVVDANPAFLPKFDYAIGLPMSRVSAMYTNNGFTFNDAIRVENGKRIFDVPQWNSVLPEKTYVTNATQVDLLRLGVKIGGNIYVSLHSTARELSQAMFPRDIAALLDGGTAAYVGQTASLAPTFHGMTFWESGLGLSFAPSEKLRAGFKVKKLYGAHAISTEKSELLLTVDEDYATTLSADLLLKTSGIQDTEFNFSNYLNNSGWSGDFGITYKLFPSFTIAASAVDIGYIKWKSNVYDYTMDKGTASFSFRGVDVQDLMDGNTGFDQELDSLSEDFKLTEAAGSPFSMALPAKFYLSGAFDITKSFTLGGLFFAEQFNGRTATGWTTSLNKNFGRWLTASVSYTISNRSYNNLGAGIAVKAGPLQIYAVGDNVLGMPVSLIKTGFINEHINSAQVFNGRFGINFVWGWKKQSTVDEEDNSKSYNSGKKDSSKPISEDNSKSYNSGKSGGKTTTNAKKQPQSKKTKQPSHIRARQRLKPE